MTSEMVEAIRNAIRDQIGNLHVAMPATIMAYNSSNGLCEVKPIGKLRKPDSTMMEYPVIAGVPICMPANIAVPVKPNQTCLLIICDADISGWISGKTAVQSMSHSLQNTVCIPELRKTPASLQNYANANNGMAIEGNLYISGNLKVQNDVHVSGGITSVGDCNAPNIRYD